jgi:hypothetical protein
MWSASNPEPIQSITGINANLKIEQETPKPGTGRSRNIRTVHVV